MASSLIRDAEIESFLQELSSPIFANAGYHADEIKIFIVNDSEINAFVAGGNNIFLHTSLIIEAETAEGLAGVIAHETGHIAGGHIALGAEAIKKASISKMVSYALGAVAAAVVGGDAGMAILAAGDNIATRNFLSFSRGNERAADRAAINYMGNITIRPLINILEKFRRRENRHIGGNDPYVRTHPLSAERIASMRNYANKQQAKELPVKMHQKYARVVAKLRGFINPKTVDYYYGNDENIPAKYARTIANYRKSNFQQAMNGINELIGLEPNNAYFYELKGQILFENGRNSRAAYKKALSLLDNSLIRTAYAQSLLINKEYNKAIKYLKISILDDEDYILNYHLLINAYGKIGDISMAKLYMAEKFLRTGKIKQAKKISEVAMKLLEKSSRKNTAAYLRATDINIEAKKSLEKEKKL